MKLPKILFTPLLILQLSLSAHAQVAFQDDFKGKVLDTTNWTVLSPNGKVMQVDRLVLTLTGSAQKTQQGKIQCVMQTKKTFARVSGGKVLRLTMDLGLSPYAFYVLGLMPDITYQQWADLNYGFHGNRLDRALWFMEGSSLSLPTPENPKGAHVLRLHDPPVKYQTYKIRLELGAVDGALWQYDFGEGWKTGRDTRGDGHGDKGKGYRFFLTADSYGDAEMLVDDVSLEYVTPTLGRRIDPPVWGPPVNADFDGKMDERWTNWAGDLGSWWAKLSVADFKTVPGWVTFHGPAGGFGLCLRHYPFLLRKTAPFYVEVHLRYPTIDPPEANYLVMASLLLDTDGDLYTDDIAIPSLVIQNIAASRKTQVRVETMVAAGQKAFISCAKNDTDLSRYWNSGDLFLRIGLKDKKTLTFSYKFKPDEPWTIFHTFEAPVANPAGLGVPIGFDLVGPCADSGWPKPPKPQCKADEVSYEIDYVHFVEDAPSNP